MLLYPQKVNMKKMTHVTTPFLEMTYTSPVHYTLERVNNKYGRAYMTSHPAITIIKYMHASVLK